MFCRGLLRLAENACLCVRDVCVEYRIFFVTYFVTTGCRKEVCQFVVVKSAFFPASSVLYPSTSYAVGDSLRTPTLAFFFVASKAVVITYFLVLVLWSGSWRHAGKDLRGTLCKSIEDISKRPLCEAMSTVVDADVEREKERERRGEREKE